MYYRGCWHMYWPWLLLKPNHFLSSRKNFTTLYQSLIHYHQFAGSRFRVLPKIPHCCVEWRVVLIPFVADSSLKSAKDYRLKLFNIKKDFEQKYLILNIIIRQRRKNYEIVKLLKNKKKTEKINKTTLIKKNSVFKLNRSSGKKVFIFFQKKLSGKYTFITHPAAMLI